MSPRPDSQQHLRDLLRPSFFSGTVAVLAGLLVSVGVIVSFQFHNSVIQQQLESWEAGNQRTLTKPGETLVENDHPGLKGTWPLIIVWCGIGLAVYLAAMMIVNFLIGAKRLGQEMGYVNANKQGRLKDLAKNLALRMISLAVLIILVVILFKRVIPYALTDANASADNLLSFGGFYYALLSWSSVAFTIYLQTIFLRLTFGKVRVF